MLNFAPLVFVYQSNGTKLGKDNLRGNMRFKMRSNEVDTPQGEVIIGYTNIGRKNVNLIL
jgi:hypothetical protein